MFQHGSARRSDAIRRIRRISPTAPRPTTPPAVAVGTQWNDGPPEILARPARPRPHIRRHGPPSESRKSPLPSSGLRPRASTNAARDRGFANPAFRNRNRRMPRISLPSTAPGGPSTGVVGTPLTSRPSKQDQAEAKRAKPLRRRSHRSKTLLQLVLPEPQSTTHRCARHARRDRFSSAPDRHPPASCRSRCAARCRCSSVPAKSDSRD